MATAPTKSQPLHNFSLPFLKWGGKNQTNSLLPKLIRPTLKVSLDLNLSKFHSALLRLKLNFSRTRDVVSENRGGFAAGESMAWGVVLLANAGTNDGLEEELELASTQILRAFLQSKRKGKRRWKVVTCLRNLKINLDGVCFFVAFHKVICHNFYTEITSLLALEDESISLLPNGPARKSKSSVPIIIPVRDVRDDPLFQAAIKKFIPIVPRD
ncbi:RNA polymerase-associated protein [Senna tora]|uniref:RNA polymerase-associated protein n=1 Tax=Senna tora TaxID=362788 RepID=A0A834X7Z3_9FABA|nr:RNA polymerase-associated protein [Senna tora]